jgi:uncharacterized protein (DUF885 family)
MAGRRPRFEYAILLAVVSLLIGGFTREPIASAAPAEVLAGNHDAPQVSAKWDKFIALFLDDYFAANPDQAVGAGKHQYDGQLPDWSEAGLKREIDRLHAQRAKALEFSEDELSPDQRFEREYVIAEIDRDLFWREVADQPHLSPFFYASSLDPDTYISRKYAPPATRLKAFTEYSKRVPAALSQIKSNLKLPLPQESIAIGRRTIGGLAGFFANEVPQAFTEVKDERLQAQFKQANEAAILAVKEFDEWLTKQRSEATEDFALGPEKFRKMLSMTEGVEISLADLERIAQRDLDRNYAAMIKACAEFAPGKTPQEANELAAARKAEGSDAVEAARQQLSGLREFVLKHDLLSIPGTEEAKVAKAPAYKAWNFAYIDIPGPFEKGLPSIYYISPPDPKWSQEKQEAYTPGRGSLLFTSAHEVYPGHFVQYLHAHRAPSAIGRVFSGYAFAEGWAHYTEEMMYNAGLGDGDPEMHIGQLQEALLRNVRFLSAIGLHTKGMTLEQSKRLFLDKAFQDEGNADQQALRGTFDPAYLNYTLGKLMIRKLRDDWTATRGGRAAWKQFHDEFLKYGGPPIPLIRRAMMGPDDKGSLF